MGSVFLGYPVYGMGPFTATNLPPTVSHCQFKQRLVTIVLLRSVTVSDNLPWPICHQPIIVIIINIYKAVPAEKNWGGNTVLPQIL